MNEQLNELESTFVEDYEAAELLLSLKKSKVAVILFSKALFSLLGYFIFERYHTLPKNHTERFRILEEREIKVYRLVDEVWHYYRDSYSKPAVEKSVLLLRKTIWEVVLSYEGYSAKIKAVTQK